MEIDREQEESRGQPIFNPIEEPTICPCNIEPHAPMDIDLIMHIPACERSFESRIRRSGIDVEARQRQVNVLTNQPNAPIQQPKKTITPKGGMFPMEL